MYMYMYMYIYVYIYIYIHNYIRTSGCAKVPSSLSCQTARGCKGVAQAAAAVAAAAAAAAAKMTFNS